MKSLIDELIEQQQKLQTPVVQFSQQYDAGSQPDLAEHYRRLIPLSKPNTDEQYAFEVSLDRCTGCKACVSACHSMNGLDEGESWRDIGAILAEDQKGWQQTITTACHHCEDPGCMNGCPVGAYEKSPETGIVRHLDDQCIGCSYCILKCPYDVPKYSAKRGIVRKCDMCHQRLSEGEAPACVQACPTEAIRIVKVSKQASKQDFYDMSLNLRTQSNFAVTRPTTRYVGRKMPSIDSLRAVDQFTLRPEHSHWPLVLMLACTQSGIGMVLGGFEHRGITTAGVITFFIGMAASVAHLGQPLKAWRFFLGLKTSWLSREILAFSLLAPLPLLILLLMWAPQWIAPYTWGKWVPQLLWVHFLILGMVSVFTSVMIYQDTHRRTWRFSLTATKFFGTCLSMGAAACLVSHQVNAVNGLLVSLIILIKWIPEVGLYMRYKKAKASDWDADLHMMRLQWISLKPIIISRITFTVLAGIILWISPITSIGFLLGAEILERLLFFKTCYAPKMPGSFGLK